jgi:hypothetical protein
VINLLVLVSGAGHSQNAEPLGNADQLTSDCAFIFSMITCRCALIVRSLLPSSRAACLFVLPRPDVEKDAACPSCSRAGLLRETSEMIRRVPPLSCPRYRSPIQSGAGTRKNRLFRQHRPESSRGMAKESGVF